MIGQRAEKVFRRFRNVAQVTLFPLSCRVCGEKVATWEDGVACEDCWIEMETRLALLKCCEKCGMWLPRQPLEIVEESGNGRRCRSCDRMVVTVARSVGPHEGALRECVLWLKRFPRIPARLRNLIRETWSGIPDRDDFDAIIPIPLHSNRLAERSFNQAEVIGELVASLTGLRLDTTSIFRHKMTERHRLGMGVDERLRSMRGAFEVRAPRLILNRRLLLVDDVLTTGSTADEAARTLINSGAREVGLLTISRANYRLKSMI